MIEETPRLAFMPLQWCSTSLSTLLDESCVDLARDRKRVIANRLMNSVRPACTRDGGIIPLQELLWGVYLQASARGMLLILKKLS